MESVFVLLWSCINKPMLPLPCPQRIISEWQTAAPASVCTEAGVMILHLYFTSKHTDSLSFDRQSSSPLSSRYSQKTSPPPHRNLMCLIQLQPSVLLFTLCLCKVTLFFFHFSEKVPLYEQSYQRQDQIWCCSCWCKTNSPCITSPKVQAWWAPHKTGTFFVQNQQTDRHLLCSWLLISL